MKRKGTGTRVLVLAGLLLVGISLLGAVLAPLGRADDDEAREYGRRENEEHGERQRWVFALRRAVEPVQNAAYAKECGACHMAYQPALLPARSWTVLLGRLDDHFGHDASLSKQTTAELRAYVTANAAESSRGETAYRILRSLNGKTPTRITEVPFIRRIHSELSPRVFERTAVGSLANCSACHRHAEQGVYSEEDVAIPR